MRELRKGVKIINRYNTDGRRFCGFEVQGEPLITHILSKRRLRAVLERQSGSPQSGFLHNGTQIDFYVCSNYHVATTTGKETSRVTRTSKITQDLKIPRPRSQHPRVRHGRAFGGRRGVWAVRTEFHVDENQGP